MPIHFNADEIFEIAEQIERNGARFYRRAAEGFEEESVQQLLLELAEWEDGHEKIFAAMRKELGALDKSETAFDPSGEAALYLQAFADGYVFDVKTDPSEKLGGEESLADVLTTAIGLEKDSVAFYLGMKELVPARFGKEKLEKIIREEMSHITKLSRELKAVAG